LACELAATWRWPTLAQMNHSELSHMAGAVDDSTINIVEVIIQRYEAPGLPFNGLHPHNPCNFMHYYSITNPERMEG